MPIFARPSGSVTEVSALQLVKAAEPIEVTLFGMITEVKDGDAPNAHHPIVVTVLGIVTEVNFVHSLKALFAIFVTVYVDPWLVTVSGIIIEPVYSECTTVTSEGEEVEIS